MKKTLAILALMSFSMSQSANKVQVKNLTDKEIGKLTFNVQYNNSRDIKLEAGHIHSFDFDKDSKLNITWRGSKYSSQKSLDNNGIYGITKKDSSENPQPLLMRQKNKKWSTVKNNSLRQHQS